MMNILLTSAGRRAYLVKYFQDALGRSGKVYASNSHYTIALQQADGYYISPLIYESHYVDSLIKYCKENAITIVLSLFDIDLLVLAKNENKFAENGIKLILAPYESVQICNDKWATYEFLINNGLCAPKTYLSVPDAKSAIHKKEILYPLVIKPRWGMASIGLYFAENEVEIDVFYKKSYKEIFSSYLKYESSLTKDFPIIIQEMIVGDEYGVDVVNDLEAKYAACFAKQKVSMRAGETDVGLTVHSKPFTFVAKKISSLINHVGILSVDCFMTKQNEIIVTEMNCRISGHYPISHVAGFNFPLVLIHWLKKRNVSKGLLKMRVGMFVIKNIEPVELFSIK